MKTSRTDIEKMMGKLETQFIDHFSLATTLGMISDICRLKADHIKENWGPPLYYGDWPERWNFLAQALEDFTEEIQDEANSLQGF